MSVECCVKEVESSLGFYVANSEENLTNALTAVGALMTLVDFTLSNARRFYSSMTNRLWQ